MADPKPSSVKKNGFHDLLPPWENKNDSFGKRKMSEARPFWGIPVITAKIALAVLVSGVGLK